MNPKQLHDCRTSVSSPPTHEYGLSAKLARSAMIGAIFGFSLIGPVANADHGNKNEIVFTAPTDDLPSWITNFLICPEEYCSPQYNASCFFNHTQCSGVWCHLAYASE